MYDLFFRLSDNERVTKASLLTTGLSEERLADLDFLKAAGLYPITNTQPYYDARYQRLGKDELYGDTETGFYLEYPVLEVDAETYQANLTIAKEAKNSEIVAKNNETYKLALGYYPETTQALWATELAQAKEYLADNNAEVPYFRLLFEQRKGISLDEFAAKIIKNNLEHTANLEALSVQATVYKELIKAAVTFAELDAVNIAFSIINTK